MMEKVATILAIGTANPANCMNQADFPDYYFRVTNCQDKTSLKHQFTRICEKSMIRKRYMHIDEEILKNNPSFCSYSAPSLDERQEITIAALPRLAERAAAAALEEWGRPRSAITHLVFHSSTGAAMPGADLHLVSSLGLRRSVCRVALYHQGCSAGATVLRFAKDLAENNPGSRVLAVCAELITAPTFRRPHEADKGSLVGHAIFGDGAAAAVVGSVGDTTGDETPLFRLVSAKQTLIPDSSEAIQGRVREVGVTYSLSPAVPRLVGENIEACLVEAFQPLGSAAGVDRDWNSLFWAPHPGGAAILREIEVRVGLEKEKLRAAWHVMKEYGNMSSCTVFFVLDEMRKWSAKEGKSTTGEGLEWGVLFGFGPGLTVETVVLRSVPLSPTA